MSQTSLMSKFSKTSLPALLYVKKWQMAKVRLHDKQQKVYTRSNISLTLSSLEDQRIKLSKMLKATSSGFP